MNETLLFMSQVCQGIPGINPQVFPASIWERGHFFVFSNFSNFGLQNLQNIQANPLFVVRKKDHKQMYQLLLKYIQPNGRSNDLKAAVSSKYRFLKFKAHLLERIMGKI